jgi:predicted transcriptional regulator
MTWKALAKRTNSLPEGWSTTDEIALDLDCEISEIPKILAAAIRDGLVERQNFPCWTPGSRQLLYQTGYRQRTGKVVSEKSPQVSDKTRAAKSAPDELTAAIHRVIARHPDKPTHRIVAYLPPRLRIGVTTAQVAAILSR